MLAFATFDYTNLFGSTGGLDAVELEELRPRLEEVARDLLENPPGFMRLPKTSEFLDSLKALADGVRTSGATDFVHVGIGDSALDPITLYRALGHPCYNRPLERLGPRLHFAENTDPMSLSAILNVYPGVAG
jgi:glucose-6-phosphate isomerase